MLCRMSHDDSIPSSETVSTPLIRTVDWLIRWRLLLLGLALLATVAAWPVSRRLAFDQSIESLYAETDPHLLDFLESRKQFGGDEFVLVAYPEADLFQSDSYALTDEAAARIKAFAEKLDQVPGVIAESTQHLATALRFPYGRDRVREIVRGVLLGHDDRTTAIVLRLAPESASPVSRGATIARVRQLAGEHDPPAMVVGEPVQIHDMFRYVEEDGRTLFVVSLALLAGVLLVLLRRLRWVLLPLLVVVISITWTEAVLVLTRMRLSMVSSMLNSLMTIIGVQTVTYLALYFREQHRTLPPVEALRRTLIDLAVPVWWTIATTALGFGVLVSSHINPVFSFGVMMCAGSLIVMLAVIFVVPGGLLLGRHSEESPPTAADRRLEAVLTRITNCVEHHPRQVAAVSLFVSAFASLGFLWLRVETDFSKNFRSSSPIVKALDFFEGRLGGAGSWEVNFPAPTPLDAEYLDRVRSFARRLKSEFGIEDESGEHADESVRHAGRISKVLALTDGLDLVPEKIPFLIKNLQDRVKVLRRVQSEFVNSLYNGQTGRMRLLLRAYERQPSEEKLQLIANVERLARETFGDAQSVPPRTLENRPQDSVNEKPAATGLFVLLAFLIESLMSDQWVSFTLAAIGITGMVWYEFRSLPIGLMSLVPNVFPNLLVVGMMGWIGLPINIATAMISCVSMGLTVNSSIIYIDAYQRARATGLGVFAALHETHRSIGQVVVYSNVALIAGFSVLSLSHFIPLVYFGLLVSLAMVGGLIGNLVFLPLLIGWWDSRRESA